MGLAEMLALVVGALMPPAVDYINRAQWPSWGKLAMSLAVSVVLGTATAWATGELASTGGWLQVVLVMFTASQVAYRTWWHRPAPKPAEPEQ